MQFLKNHYEKIILSIVLLGLVGAVAVLFVQVGSVKSSIKKVEDTLVAGSKPVQVRPHEEFDAALQMGTNPPAIDLGRGHLLFNPYKWVLDGNQKMIKVDSEEKLGPGAIKVLSVSNLNFTIALVRVSGSGDNPSYQISTKRDVVDRVARNHYMRLMDKARPFPYGETTATFTLKEVRGEPAKPAEIVLDFEKPEDLGGLTEVVLKENEPYIELVGREADLDYPPLKKTFPKVKVGDSLNLGSESYKVIAITDRQVIFEAQNKKRTIIDYASGVPQ